MPAIPDAAALARFALFEDLTPAEIEAIRRLLHVTTVPAGAGLFTVEQPGEVAYVVLSGTLKIHVEQADGGDVILAILGPGEIVGEMSLVDHLTRSASVVTMEESTLLWLGRQDLWGCLETMPTLACNLVRILSRRLRLANAQVQALASLDVYGRVARQLLAFADAYGRPESNGDVRIPLRLTQTDLAGLVGASRVRVNQVLVDYQRQHYLSVNAQRHFIIHDADSLADYLV